MGDDKEQTVGCSLVQPFPQEASGFASDEHLLVSSQHEERFLDLTENAQLGD